MPKEKRVTNNQEEESEYRILKPGQMWTQYIETRPEEFKEKDKNKKLRNIDLLKSGLERPFVEFKKRFGYYPNLILVSDKSFSVDDIREIAKSETILSPDGGTVTIKIAKQGLNLVNLTTEKSMRDEEILKQKERENKENKNEEKE